MLGDTSPPRTPDASSSTAAASGSTGGVFSWLTGSSKSPTYGTTNPSGTPPLPLTIRTSVTGSNSPASSVSPAGSRGSATSSPAQSPASTRTKRRFVIPNVAASPVGRMGGIVTFNISTKTRTATDKSDDANNAAQDLEEEIDLIQRTEYTGSPSKTVVVKKTMTSTEAMPTDISENQQIEYITTTIRSPVAKTVTTTTTTSSDNQTEHLPLEEKAAANVQYVTKTVQGEPGKTVRYVTTTTTANNNNGETLSADQQAAANVQYVTKTVQGEPGKTVRYVTTTTTANNSNGEPLSTEAQRQNVQYKYITKTLPATSTETKTVVQSANSPSSQHKIVYVAGQPQQQVQYVTKTVASPSQQQVQVSPQHHVQYITTTTTAASPAHGAPSPASSTSSTSSSTLNRNVWMVAGQPQHVQYVSRSPVHQQKVQHVTTTSTTPQHQQQSQTQYVTITKKVASVGSGYGSDSSASARLVSTPASATATGAATSTTTSTTTSAVSPPPVPIKLVDGVEGLPPVHFVGVRRPASDYASSDGEMSDVELVFDIMSQTFKPVRKGVVVSRKAKAAGSTASIGSAASYRSGASGQSQSANASANANAAAVATATALASGGYAAAAAARPRRRSSASKSKTNLDEEKAAAETATEEDKDAKAKASGAAIAVGAGVAVAAVAATAAAAAVASGASPMMKLDTVSSPQGPTAISPSGLKKRTASQTKREPSPRKFFGSSPTTTASAAAGVAPSVPDEDVTLNVDEPTYAELRSPSNNNSSDPENSRLSQIALLLKLRVCHWFLITVVAVAVILCLTFIFYKGVALRKYQGSEVASYKDRYDQADNYNGYVALISTLFATPIELMVAIIVPMVFFALVSKMILGAKISTRVKTLYFSFSWIISYLLSSGFHAINVQLRIQNIEPVISLMDLSLQVSAATTLAELSIANVSSNASFVVTESGVGNSVTNTVLRNCILTPVDSDTGSDTTTTSTGINTLAKTTKLRNLEASAVAATSSSASTRQCSNTPTLPAAASFFSGAISQLSSKTVTTYGFPTRSWQEEMLPGALPEKNYTLTFDTKLQKLEILPMATRKAANLFLHGVHVARDVFGWFKNTESPLGVQKAIKSKYATTSATDGKLTYVTVSDLLNLTTPGNAVDDALAASSFLDQARTLFKQSLSDAANISVSESTLEFSRVALPNDYTFDSVTMNIPLAKNFLSRQLKASGDKFIEDLDVQDDGKTYYYDLDIANDCGPYSGVCEVRRTEYDAKGNVYEPPTTVRAFSLCTNSQGTEDLEVFFDAAKIGDAPSYSCKSKCDTGMLVITVSSRIVGDALIEGPSTDVPRLVSGLATLKNPRKIYSLTVGRLTWTNTNFALKFHAACALGVGKCTGLEYALGAALKNTTQIIKDTIGTLRGSNTNDTEESDDDKHLIVGSTFVPLNYLSPFSYNATEATTTTTDNSKKSVSGWPLISITKPLEVDSLFENDGDIVVPANFDVVNWKTKSRKDTQCSATVEARLDSVLNNHYYIERGVQPAYTSAMYFLFQDAVTKAEVALATSGQITLGFTKNIEFVELRASIPLLNVVLTCIGCGAVLLVALIVFFVMRGSTKRYAVASDSCPSSSSTFIVPSEGVARIKLDKSLFPPFVLSRRLEDSSAAPAHSTTTTGTAASSKGPRQDESEDVDDFVVDTMGMQHDHRDGVVNVGAANK